jgi:Protein of unknown function (DUF3072)
VLVVVLFPCASVTLKMTDKTVAVMMDEQAKLLKRLSQDAYEPQAFKPNLTQAEAARRIVALQAKLTLQGEPPHTL